MTVTTTPPSEWNDLIPNFESVEPAKADFSKFLPQKEETLNTLTDSEKDTTDDLTNTIVEESTTPTPNKDNQQEDNLLDSKTSSYINKLIEEQVLLPFENSEIKTFEDLRELISLNRDNTFQTAAERNFEENLSALPPQFQSVIKYGLNGGQDVQSLLQDWADAERTINLDISSEEGQAQVVAEYLTRTNYGTKEQIAEDIQTWKDLGKLSSKAEIYKPKLDEFQMQRILAKEAEAAQTKQQEEAFTNNFLSSIEGVLVNDKTTLGLEIPNTLKQSLYNESMPKYTSQITGRQIDALEAIVEEVKFGANANPAFYAELMLHAAYPEEYKKMLLSQVKAEVAQTERKLKIQQVQGDMGKTSHTTVQNKSKIRPISF